jgi:ubiquitin-conjugating enzyme E2 Q
VCHERIDAAYEPLKPYVCASKLCEYQYYNLNMGPSLEVRACLARCSAR